MVYKHRWIVFLCFIVLFLYGGLIAAQNFSYKTSVDPVKLKSYYRIKLIPQVVGRCQFGLQDLRIKDERGNEVPYLLLKDVGSYQSENYRDFTIISTKSTQGATVYLIDRLDGKPNQQLILKISNADIEKSLSFEGSNNTTSWYAIQSIRLNPFYLGGDSVKEAIINLPTTNHRYLRCVVNDSTTGKIDIKGFGFKEIFKNGVNNFEMPQAAYSQIDIDSNKTTIIEIKYNQTFLINQLSVEIKEDWDFYREVNVEAWVGSIKDGRYIQLGQGRFASYFDKNIIQLQDVLTHKLRLTIYNKDSPPLKISGIKAYQKPTWIVAPLDSSKQYTLYYGDNTLAAPEYDLEYFEQKLKEDFPRARLGSTFMIIQKEQQDKKDGELNNYYIGTCIILVTGLLLFMTWKMLKEMKVRADV